ncbi:MAG: flippase-like domain-containing protein, partial [Candidatus Nanohaloarchaeota archaeon QJJ-9]|nr:flippase-like domain-containing protein [Candidatus Nanohaloarchaeota archaeon QJJ-9]
MKVLVMEGWTKRTLFNLGVALVILAVFFHFIGIGEIIKAFRSAKLPFALIGFVSGFGMVLGWIAIWRMVYNLTGYTFNLKELFEIYFAGNFANNITPFGQAGGEPFIAYIMSKKTDLSFSKSFAGVMCADVLRGVPYLVLSFLGL